MGAFGAAALDRNSSTRVRKHSSPHSYYLLLTTYVYVLSNRGSVSLPNAPQGMADEHFTHDFHTCTVLRLYD